MSHLAIEKHECTKSSYGLVPQFFTLMIQKGICIKSIALHSLILLDGLETIIHYPVILFELLTN